MYNYKKVISDEVRKYMSDEVWRYEESPFHYNFCWDVVSCRQRDAYFDSAEEALEALVGNEDLLKRAIEYKQCPSHPLEEIVKEAQNNPIYADVLIREYLFPEIWNECFAEVNSMDYDEMTNSEFVLALSCMANDDGTWYPEMKQRSGLEKDEDESIEEYYKRAAYKLLLDSLKDILL